MALSHQLESWSDLCARDGTAAICQPLIDPLYGTRGLHEAIALLLGEPERSAYDIVRQTWQARAVGDFETYWRASLRNGVVEGTAQTPVSPPPPPAGHAAVCGFHRPHALSVRGPMHLRRKQGE